MMHYLRMTEITVGGRMASGVVQIRAKWENVDTGEDGAAFLLLSMDQARQMAADLKILADLPPPASPFDA